MTRYLSNRDGNGKTNEEGHYRLLSKMTEGQVMSTTDLKVTENSSLGLSVFVQAGDYKIDAQSGSYSYMGWLDATETVNITTPDPANPRITAIVLYVDKSAVTSASPPNNPGITKLMAVNGAASGTPTAPTNTTIQSAVGSNNPFIRLANVAVASGVTQITNADITDTRVRIKLSNNVLENSSLAQYVGPLLFPIGSIYTNAVDSTNPATLLGFGTWTQFAQGRVPVGINVGDADFDAPQKTGGSKTATITTDQLPPHSHVVDPPATGTSWVGDHIHGFGSVLDNLGGGNNNNALTSYPGANVRITNKNTGGGGAHAHTVDIGAFNSANTGNGQGHPNVQPYIVVYMWRRTA